MVNTAKTATILLIALCVGCPRVRAAETLSAAEVLRRVEEHSMAAVRAEASLQRAESDLSRSESAWWPSLNLRARYVARDNQIEVTDPESGFTFPTTNQRNAQYELDLRELIYDGGRRRRRVKVAEIGREVASEKGRALVQEEQVAALHAYLRAVTLQGRRAVLDRREESLNEHLEVVRDLYEQGLVARNDLLETQVQLRRIQDAVARLENDQRVALLELARTMGGGPSAEWTVPDSLPSLPPLSGEVEDQLQRALQANARLRAAGARERQAEVGYDLTRREGWPELVAGVSHSWQQNDYLVYESLNQAYVGLEWELFDGGRRRADRARAVASLRESRRARTEVQRRVEVEVEKLARSYDQSRREESTARQNVAAAAENYRIVEDQYREGLARASDVLDAESLLAQSEFDVLDRRAQSYLLRAQLAAAVGSDLVRAFAAIPMTSSKEN